MEEYRKYRGKRFFDRLMGIPVVSDIVLWCLSDDDSPSKADCNKAKKLLKNVIRLSEKKGRKIPENRKNSLKDKINNKSITSSDLPGSIQSEFPASLRGKTLAEIEAICG